MQLTNKTVLITGGASGIGKIMVRLCLERKAKVIIWDINQTGIDNTITEFKNLGEIAGFAVDVSNPIQIEETAQKVKQEIGFVDVIINNAGIIVGKYFHEHSSDEIDN
ncbi:MAG: SDR family NAD(P)-dependent oxidoreductase, partial [Flavobacteriales bacterium]